MSTLLTKMKEWRWQTSSRRRRRLVARSANATTDRRVKVFTFLFAAVAPIFKYSKVSETKQQIPINENKTQYGTILDRSDQGLTHF